jgi:hypothetical protein
MGKCSIECRWGSFFFFFCFSTFCQRNGFFQIRVTGLKFNKRFVSEYRKYFIRQRWLPVTEGHFTPTSSEAFPHNASQYVWYEVTKKGTKMLRNKLRKTLVMKLTSYEIVTQPIGIIYYDVL